MKKYIIATRCSLAKVSDRLTATNTTYQFGYKMLSTALMNKGIKRTLAGNKLHFWSVDEDVFNTITSPVFDAMFSSQDGIDVTPIAYITDEDYNLAFDEVNSMPEFSKMNKDLYKKYEEAFVKHLCNNVKLINKEVDL